MAFFPFALWGLLRRPNLTLAASIALYFAARWVRVGFPDTYPDQENGTFNPFCWQMLMVLGGLVRSSPARRAARLAHRLPGSAWLAGAYLVCDGHNLDDAISPTIVRLFAGCRASTGISPTDKENLAPVPRDPFPRARFSSATHLIPR